LTTEAMVADAPKDESGAGGGMPGGDMGGVVVMAPDSSSGRRNGQLHAHAAHAAHTTHVAARHAAAGT